MSAIERLQSELSDLASLLEPLDREPLEEWSPEWMSRQALLTRDSWLRHELSLAQGEFQFEVSLFGERVHGEAIEVSFIGRFLEELQATVNAVGDAIMFGAREHQQGRLSDQVMDAAMMKLVATRPGSFVIGLEGPPERSRQRSFEDDAEDEPIPVFDEAIARVLDVIDVAENEVAGESLPLAVSGLGSHRAVSNVIKLAGLLASNGTTARTIDRSPFRSEPREAILTAGGARRLETLLERTQVTTDPMTLRGKLTGVRWKSNVFDLELEGAAADAEAEVITGKIASELRDDVRAVFDRPARMTVERTITRTEVEGEATTTYKLVEIEALPEP